MCVRAAEREREREDYRIAAEMLDVVRSASLCL